MSRKIVLPLIVLGAAGVLFLLQPRDKNLAGEAKTSVVESSSTRTTMKAVTLVKAAPAEKSAATVAVVEPPKTVPAIPKDEAPQVVLDWSTDLGRGMLDAFKDAGKADQMFVFLRNCAEDQSVGLTYRAVCAGNAKRLADRFPEKYSQNFGGFKRGLPERIQQFLAQVQTNF